MKNKILICGATGFVGSFPFQKQNSKNIIYIS